MQFQPEARDFIAIAVIIALVLFKMTGHNGGLDTPVALIIGYYFARRQDNPVVLTKKDIQNI